MSTDVSQNPPECTNSVCIDESMNSLRSQLVSFEELADELIQSLKLEEQKNSNAGAEDMNVNADVQVEETVKLLMNVNK